MLCRSRRTTRSGSQWSESFAGWVPSHVISFFLSSALPSGTSTRQSSGTTRTERCHHTVYICYQKLFLVLRGSCRLLECHRQSVIVRVIIVIHGIFWASKQEHVQSRGKTMDGLKPIRGLRVVVPTRINILKHFNLASFANIVRGSQDFALV